MKLKDFLKQFENCNPEIEIGIANSCYFISNIKINKAKTVSSVFKNGRVLASNSLHPSNPVKNKDLQDVLLISGL